MFPPLIAFSISWCLFLSVLNFLVLCLGVLWELGSDLLVRLLLFVLLLFSLRWYVLVLALLLDLDFELALLLDPDFWLARLGMLVMVDPLDCSDVTVSTDGWCLSCCLDLWDGLVAFAGCGVLLVCLEVNVGLETLETFEVCDPPPTNRRGNGFAK